MSYCVNCGVELADSEKFCPLCNVEVINPAKPWTEPQTRPYPHRIERLASRIDRRYIAAFISILLIIPLITVVFCNLITTPEWLWSLYVAGALALGFIVVLLPMLLKKAVAFWCVAADFVAAGLYMSLIEWMAGGDWLVGLGLPLAAAACAYALILVAIIRAKKPDSVLVKFALGLFLTGLLAVAINLIISLYLKLTPIINWSVYVFVSVTVLGICSLILNGRANLRTQLKRRFFI